MNVIGVSESSGSTVLEDDKKYTSKKDAFTNTQSNCVTIKQPKENVVTVHIDSLMPFSSQVLLEPLEFTMKRQNYEQIDDYQYIKRNCPTFKSKVEYDEDDECDHEEVEYDEDNESDKEEENINKKQKFLDYYKNVSSFAVRELITGKKFEKLTMILLRSQIFAQW